MHGCVYVCACNDDLSSTFSLALQSFSVNLVGTPAQVYAPFDPSQANI